MSTDVSLPTASGAHASQAPLVTFALFAYNQEKFIREAVEGAFAQTYEPLEIILSDDCSTDRTFEIMQEMAAAYRGPHRVRAVQTPQNLGVVQHVLLRGREAAGEIVVVAAGDDISLPERVARHVPCYADPKVWAVSTGFHLIDDNGLVVAKNETIPIGLRGRRKYQTYIKRKIVVIQGSTASYKRNVFEIISRDKKINFSEDNLFNFLIPSIGYNIKLITDPLIMYRVHAAALANRPAGIGDWRSHEIRSAQLFEMELEKIQFFLEFSQFHRLEENVDILALKKNLIALHDLKTWSHIRLNARVVSILRDLLHGRTYALPSKLIRLFGRFPNYWPKRLIVTCLCKYHQYREWKMRKRCEPSR